MPPASEPNALPGLEPTLPSSWYLRDKYFELEREHIFMREWVCAGREEELPATGDHKVLDLCGESILLLRNDQSELKAFYNVCRHRGARVHERGVYAPMEDWNLDVRRYVRNRIGHLDDSTA